MVKYSQNIHKEDGQMNIFPENKRLILANETTGNATIIEGFIKIICVPEGEAPIEARSGLEGIILPFVTNSLIDNSAYSFNYITPQEIVIRVLEEVLPEIADLWRSAGYPKKPNEDRWDGFCFEEEEVMTIDFETMGASHKKELEILNKVMNTPPYSIHMRDIYAENITLN